MTYDPDSATHSQVASPSIFVAPAAGTLYQAVTSPEVSVSPVAGQSLEYWLAVHYAHQGQQVPDQPDNSWSPWNGDYGGWAIGGFGAFGWGDLIPNGMVVPVSYSGSYERISVPLGTGRWTVAHQADHYDWAARDDLFSDWEYFSQAASMTATEIPASGDELARWVLGIGSPYTGEIGPRSAELAHGVKGITGGTFEYTQSNFGFVTDVWMTNTGFLSPTWQMPGGYRYQVSISSTTPGASSSSFGLAVTDMLGNNKATTYSSTPYFDAPDGALVGARFSLLVGSLTSINLRMTVLRTPL